MNFCNSLILDMIGMELSDPLWLIKNGLEKIIHFF